MQQILDQASLVPGITNYGFSRSGDQLLWRSAFDDVDNMLDNFARIEPMFDQLLAGPAALDRFEFESPVSQIERVMNATNLLSDKITRENVRYFETEEDEDAHGFFRRTISGVGAVPKLESQVTLKPQYDVKDWEATRPLMHQIINNISADPKCTYFSWNKFGDTLSSRATFTDGEAVKNYLTNSKAIMDQLESGPAKLKRLEIHGSHDQLEQTKQIASEYKPEYFEIEPMKLSEAKVSAVESGETEGSTATGAAEPSK